jgi:hypothetical protein
MSEAMVLLLVARYPHPKALARRAPSSSCFPGLARLQAAGLVAKRGGVYRLTRRGRSELELGRALRLAVDRGFGFSRLPEPRVSAPGPRAEREREPASTTLGRGERDLS